MSATTNKLVASLKKYIIPTGAIAASILGAAIILHSNHVSASAVTAAPLDDNSCIPHHRHGQSHGVPRRPRNPGRRQHRRHRQTRRDRPPSSKAPTTRIYPPASLSSSATAAAARPRSSLSSSTASAAASSSRPTATSSPTTT